jgi:hypothetical protein
MANKFDSIQFENEIQIIIGKIKDLKEGDPKFLEMAKKINYEEINAKWNYMVKDVLNPSLKDCTDEIRLLGEAIIKYNPEAKKAIKPIEMLPLPLILPLIEEKPESSPDSKKGVPKKGGYKLP